MKYFTSTIPLPLAEKLEEKGMPIRHANRLVNACPNSTRRVDVIGKVLVCPMYAEAFDWLMLEKEIYLSITQQWVYAGGETTAWIPLVNGLSRGVYDTWHEAAEAAIEKALELI